MNEDVRVEKVSKLIRLVCMQQDEGILKLNGKESNPHDRCCNLRSSSYVSLQTREPQPPLIICQVINMSSTVEL